MTESSFSPTRETSAYWCFHLTSILSSTILHLHLLTPFIHLEWLHHALADSARPRHQNHHSYIKYYYSTLPSILLLYSLRSTEILNNTTFVQSAWQRGSQWTETGPASFPNRWFCHVHQLLHRGTTRRTLLRPAAKFSRSRHPIILRVLYGVCTPYIPNCHADIDDLFRFSLIRSIRSPGQSAAACSMQHAAAGINHQEKILASPPAIAGGIIRLVPLPLLGVPEAA